MAAAEKRDLLRTLAWLFWARWRKQISAAMAAVVVFAILTMSRQLRLSLKTQGPVLKAKLRDLLR